VFRAVPLPSVLFKLKQMKKYLIAIALLCIGIWFGQILFNHVFSWLGIFWTIGVIGVFLNYIYKQVKSYDNEKSV